MTQPKKKKPSAEDYREEHNQRLIAKNLERSAETRKQAPTLEAKIRAQPDDEFAKVERLLAYSHQRLFTAQRHGLGPEREARIIADIDELEAERVALEATKEGS